MHICLCRSRRSRTGRLRPVGRRGARDGSKFFWKSLEFFVDFRLCKTFLKVTYTFTAHFVVFHSLFSVRVSEFPLTGRRPTATRIEHRSVPSHRTNSFHDPPHISPPPPSQDINNNPAPSRSPEPGGGGPDVAFGRAISPEVKKQPALTDPDERLQLQRLEQSNQTLKQNLVDLHRDRAELERNELLERCFLQLDAELGELREELMEASSSPESRRDGGEDGASYRPSSPEFVPDVPPRSRPPDEVERQQNRSGDFGGSPPEIEEVVPDATYQKLDDFLASPIWSETEAALSAAFRRGREGDAGAVGHGRGVCGLEVIVWCF